MAKKQTGTSTPTMTDKAAIELLMELMAIPGKSGEEGPIMKAITDRLIAAGLPKKAASFDTAHRKSVHPGEVGNLIVKLPAREMKGAARRMFSAHVDTVPICVGCKPVKKGKVITSADPKTGLGGDDRAGTAILLSTLLSLLKSDVPHPPLTFLWTIQEEIGLNGAKHVTANKLGKPGLAFNYDGGTPTKLTIGATGGYRMDITIGGIASHAGAAPAEGVSAIAIASLAIADLVNNGWHGQIEKDGKEGTSNIGVIQGGDATNVVTDLVTLRAEARSHNSAFRKKIVREIEQAFKRAAKSVNNLAGKCGTVAFEGDLDYDAFRLKPSDPSVKAAHTAVAAEGLKPELYIANGGLDANWLNAHGVPAVTMGCGQSKIHTVNEELIISEFQQARQIAWRLATAAE